MIYEPFQTEFLDAGNAHGNIIENGLNVFLYQGQQAFNIWHKIEPEINQELIKIYGEEISFDPSKNHILLWVTPLIVLIIIFIFIRNKIRFFKRV